MSRRTIIAFLVGLVLASVHFGDAQQSAKVPRIGYLNATAPSAVSARVEAFREACASLGT